MEASSYSVPERYPASEGRGPGWKLSMGKGSKPSAAAAEESVIAVLFSHPDFFDGAYEKLKPEQMVTALNTRIYGKICEVLSDGRKLDISQFSGILSDAQMGYLVSVVNSDMARENPLTVLKDSISVILDGKSKKSAADIKNMDVDEWAENLRKVIENKKRGKKDE